MDRFTVMKSFVSVVETSSFSVAARALGLSRALVSRHIADLEQQVGARLLNRTTRSVTLTEAGISHFDFCQRILAEIKEEEESLRGLRERPEGALGIVSPKWIGSLDLGDAIASFAAEYPLIKVRLELGGMSDRTHEFLSSGYEIAFQTKYLRDSSVMVKKMATLQFVVCASPAYLARSRRPMEPRDLLEHKCLVHTNDPIWHFTTEEEKLRIKVENVAFSSNTFLVLQKAAVQGLGIAMLPLRSALRELREGELEIVLPGFKVPDRPLYAIYAPGAHRIRKIQCFLDFIYNWYRVHPVSELENARESRLAEID
ncbi:HTH-type transcriptional regulator DmlR [Pigmentiphaga humi]|uniref:HTH-type transcriptional regulator DmlR n=1 Tax=Pigmentiphaga humi TaxID=2478468 RepID=A0A3P4B3D1_9BURK|nr:LysR family transcriptional regulator [Pigmentiphaga humi]VCU70421.1 HTH-type transcriptional regulator DmlR [Pigmentiphaga humi]